MRMEAPGQITYGTRVRIKQGWGGAGRVGKALGSPIMEEQEWVPLIWDGEQDPDFHKLAGIETYTAESLLAEMKSKLKSCPFEGGRAKFRSGGKILETDTGYVHSSVMCTICGIEVISDTHVNGKLMSREWQDMDAIKRWNARAE